MMLRFIFIQILFIAFVSASAANNGYLLGKDSSCKVWWTGNTYKVMRDDPVPTKKGKVVIQSARNEAEGFQLVLSP